MMHRGCGQQHNTLLLKWAFLSACFLAYSFVVEANSATSNSLLLRVRLQDGTVQRLEVPSDKRETLSLQDALRSVVPELNGLSVHLSSKEQDTDKTIHELGLKQGSLLSIVSSRAKKSTLTQKKQESCDAVSSQRWDPFPDLAKDYSAAIRRSKTRRSTGGQSYADLAHIQSELHVVEPQPKGPLLRLYMCPISAERFQAAGIQRKTNKINSRAGLLLGNFARERVDLKRSTKHRTSLSTQPTLEDFCSVAKVQAIWEPSNNSGGQVYDATGLSGFADGRNPEAAKAIKVASWLGMEPVGWIFSYQGQRHSPKDDDNLPVHCMDVRTGAQLQIENMKQKGREDGAKFVTAAMDAATGATEAFQLSDVSVQMVAEDMILPPNDTSKMRKEPTKQKKSAETVDANKAGRFGKTRHSILVDGKETKELDSVLCLVNTAMLSKEGSYAGRRLSVKKNGSLSNKTRKTLLTLLDKSDQELFEELCNFHTLLALYDLLGEGECKRLCELVRKWARGQKKGTAMDDKLKKRLKNIVADQ